MKEQTFAEQLVLHRLLSPASTHSVLAKRDTIWPQEVRDLANLKSIETDST